MKDSILSEPMAFNNLLALKSMLISNEINVMSSTKLTEVKRIEL